MPSYLTNILRFALVRSSSVPLLELGSVDRWTCQVQRIGPSSVVLSAGVGQAITFEHALLRYTGCSIVLLDPSPTGVTTMSQSAWQLPKIDFRPIGLAGHDGRVGFDPPDRADEGSWKTGGRDCQSFFECRSVSSLMQENGWNHIDLLKMDIEGFEYAVIDDILAHRLDVRQICVEFHCDTQIRVSYTRLHVLRYVLRLILAGYRLVHWTNSEFTFVRVP